MTHLFRQNRNSWEICNLFFFFSRQKQPDLLESFTGDEDGRADGSIEQSETEERGRSENRVEAEEEEEEESNGGWKRWTACLGKVFPFDAL